MSFVSRNITYRIKLLKSTWNNPAKASSLKPVNVLFMPFATSKEKHQKPYIELYEKFYSPANRPVNILVAQAGLSDMWFPAKGKHFSNEIMDSMNKHLCPTSKIIVHAMSIGHFIHSSLSYYDKSGGYLGRIAGQIYDSPIYGGSIKDGGLETIIDGWVETALIKSPVLRHPYLQKMMKGAAWILFKRKVKHWDNIYSNWELKSAIAPILAYHSSNDILCDTTKYEELIKNWDTNGVDITAVNLKSSPHVKHLAQHPDIYEKHFQTFVKNLKI